MCQVGFAFPPDYKYRNDSDDANNKLSLIALFIAIISRRNGGRFINDIKWLLLSWIERPLSLRRAVSSIISQNFHSGRERHTYTYTFAHVIQLIYTLYILFEQSYGFTIFIPTCTYLLDYYYLKSEKKTIVYNDLNITYI